MNYLARFLESRRTLEKVQGFIRVDATKWRGQHYDAEVTNEPTLDPPGVRPAFIIRYQARC